MSAERADLEEFKFDPEIIYPRDEFVERMEILGVLCPNNPTVLNYVEEIVEWAKHHSEDTVFEWINGEDGLIHPVACLNFKSNIV